MKKLSLMTTSLVLSTLLAGCSIIQLENNPTKEPVSQVKEATSQIASSQQTNDLEHLVELFHKEYPNMLISEIDREDVNQPHYEVEAYDDTMVYHLTYNSQSKQLKEVSSSFIEGDDYYIPLDDTSLYNANHILAVVKEMDKEAKIIKWRMSAETGDDQTFLIVQTPTETKEIIVDNATQEILQQEEE